MACHNTYSDAHVFEAGIMELLDSFEEFAQTHLYRDGWKKTDGGAEVDGSQYVEYSGTFYFTVRPKPLTVKGQLYKNWWTGIASKVWSFRIEYRYQVRFVFQPRGPRQTWVSYTTLEDIDPQHTSGLAPGLPIGVDFEVPALPRRKGEINGDIGWEFLAKWARAKLGLPPDPSALPNVEEAKFFLLASGILLACLAVFAPHVTLFGFLGHGAMGAMVWGLGYRNVQRGKLASAKATSVAAAIISSLLALVDLSTQGIGLAFFDGLSIFCLARAISILNKAL